MMTSLRTKSDKAIFMARLSEDNIFIPAKFFCGTVVTCFLPYTVVYTVPLSQSHHVVFSQLLINLTAVKKNLRDKQVFCGA